MKSRTRTTSEQSTDRLLDVSLSMVASSQISYAVHERLLQRHFKDSEDSPKAIDNGRWQEAHAADRKSAKEWFELGVATEAGAFGFNALNGHFDHFSVPTAIMGVTGLAALSGAGIRLASRRTHVLKRVYKTMQAKVDERVAEMLDVGDLPPLNDTAAWSAIDHAKLVMTHRDLKRFEAEVVKELSPSGNTDKAFEHASHLV